MKTFKKIILSLLIALGCVSGLSAQILYKVEKQGSDKVSYLLGTHHFAPLSVVDEIAELPGIIGSVDKLYGEIDMSQMTDPDVMLSMQKVVAAPSDSTLDKLLTPEQLQTLTEEWNKLTGGAAPMEMLYGLKPSVLTAQIVSIMTMKIFPEVNPMEGIDMTMQNRARELGKKVDGLESFDFQMDLLYNQPMQAQVKDLMKMVSDMDKAEAEAIALSKAYVDHDIDTMLMKMEEEEDDPALSERMIYGRNDAWVKKLTSEMPSESLMVVVGAGHLPGKRGVIEGLRKNGFTVTPIK